MSHQLNYTTLSRLNKFFECLRDGLADGGGIRGLSELLILREIMHRVRYDNDLTQIPRPCDYFDLIGGTSTGG
jgi:patatin-like phospholipase/acyl hydrolase